MLDVDAAATLIDRLWRKASACATTPPDATEAEYFAPSGALPQRYDERRAFVRHHLRDRGILKTGAACYGVYTRDISREGVGVLSPVQLFPLDRVRLLLPSGKAVDAVVRRCRRLGEGCYLVGLRFGA